MRIAYVVDTFPKRSETFVRDEVEWLAARGLLDRVFTLQQEDAARFDVSDRVRARTYVLDTPSRSPGALMRRRAQWWAQQPGLLTSRVKALSLSRESPEIFAMGAVLAEQLRTNPPDVLHVHFAGLSLQIARYAARLTGIPLTFCVHHYDLFMTPPANLAVLAKEAARIVTISRYNRRALTRDHGVPHHKIQIVHCGIDPERFAPNPPVDDACDTARPLRLVNVGRLAPVKAHQDLVAGCSALAQRGVDFRLDIIGDGQERAALEARIEALGLGERVRLLGAQSSHVVRQTLAQADVFVMSSLSEGIPVALMEAMACEVAVVSTGVRGIPELVADERTGLLVPPEEPERLAAAIERLARDPALRQRLARAGRRKVLREFNAETEYRRLVTLWSALQQLPTAALICAE